MPLVHWTQGTFLDKLANVTDPERTQDLGEDSPYFEGEAALEDAAFLVQARSTRRYREGTATAP